MANRVESAIMLDVLIQDYQRFSAISDITLALYEFSIGKAIDYRLLDICFGFLQVDPTTSIQSNLEFLMTPGVYKIPSFKALILNDQQITPIDLHTDISAIAPLSNSYVFGSMFLTLRNNNSVQIEPVLVKGDEGSGSQDPLPIIMVKDITIDKMINYIKRNDFINVIPPLTNFVGTLTAYALINNFIADVDYINTISDYNITTYIVDYRKLRSWGAYAEETMSLSFVPIFINHKNTTIIEVNNCKNIIKELIRNWITLSGWEPTFQLFWQFHSMPSHLKQFILNEFSIFIP